MSVVTGWTVHYRRSDSSNVMTTSHNVNVNNDVLMGLDKGTSYIVSVAASNSAGMGPFTNKTITTLIDCKKCFNIINQCV